jgi:hypothetical protein
MTTPTYSITPADIALYGNCPVKQKNRKGKDSVRQDEDIGFKIVRQVVLKAYSMLLHQHKVPSWKWVRSYIDISYRKICDIESPHDVFKSAEGIFLALHRWYHSMFLDELHFEGVPNVPISLPLGKGYRFTDNIDLVGLDTDKGITLVDLVPFDEIQKGRMYNDLTVHARVWGFEHDTQLSVSRYCRVIVHPRRSSLRTVWFDKNPMLKRKEQIKSYINYLMMGIINEMYYPSLSVQCDTCPYVVQCHI